MSDINPNVNLNTQTVDTNENGSVDAGSGGDITFDSLEGAGVAPNPSSTKLTTKSSKQEREEEEASKGNSKEVSEDGEEAPKKAAAAPKAEPEAAVKAEEDTSASKSLKLKVGPRGKEIELDLDTKIPHKVDGVDVEVSLKDLRDNYSGKVAYDKRFTELDQRDKAYLKDKSETEEAITNILKPIYQKSDAVGAILEMVKIANIDPAPVFAALKEQLIGDLDKFVGMSSEERDIHFLRKENEFLKRSKESEEKKVQEEQAKSALNQELTSMQETLKVTDEWISKADQEIRSNPKAYEGLTDAKGRIQVADAMRRWELASAALSILDPEYASDADALEVAARKLYGFEGTPTQALQKIRPKWQPPANEAKSASLENLGKKVEQNRKLGGNDALPPPSVKASKEVEDAAFDPRGWDSL